MAAQPAAVDHFSGPYLARTERKVDGWPLESGPLKTLANIGLFSGDVARVPWLKYLKRYHADSGRVLYSATTKALNNEGLRGLAALSLDGWNVIVGTTKNTDELHIRITRTTNV